MLTNKTFAQRNLNAGGIEFIRTNSDGSDNLVFVLLTNIDVLLF
jgi:hypothetical protein